MSEARGAVIVTWVALATEAVVLAALVLLAIGHAA